MYQRHEDHNEAIEWARDMLNVEGAVILDSETADLYGEIIELAIIDLNGMPLFNERMRPSTPVSPGAYAVHAIGDDDLAICPTFPEFYDQIRGILEAAPMVLIYNAAYDARRLDHMCKLYQLPRLTFTMNCIMEMYAQYVGEWNDYHGNYRWQKLPSADHSAQADCQAALLVIKRMAATELVGEAEG